MLVTHTSPSHRDSDDRELTFYFSCMIDVRTTDLVAAKIDESHISSDNVVSLQLECGSRCEQRRFYPTQVCFLTWSSLSRLNPSSFFTCNPSHFPLSFSN